MERINKNPCFHNFFVYLPLILVTLLIFMIYSTYICTYIVYSVNPKGLPSNLDPTDLYYSYNINNDPNHHNDHIKGYLFGFLITYNYILLMISMLRAVFMDPGYLQEPKELEYKITTLSINKDQTKLSKMSREITQLQDTFKYSPLTFNESQNLRSQVVTTNLNFINGNDNENENENEHGKDISFEHKIKYNACSQKTIQFDDKIDIIQNFKPFVIDSSSLCVTCLRMKCERVHHCRMCGRCVMKMDHHCPWIANCVGYRNYKYFNLMNFYGLVTCLIFVCSFWEVIVDVFESKIATFGHCVYFLFVYVSGIGFLSFLLWLNYNNLILVFTGQTIIEQSDRERFPSSKANNEYDLGYYKNFTNVFGTNPLVWLLPCYANYEGEGIIFEKNQSLLHTIETV